MKKFLLLIVFSLLSSQFILNAQSCISDVFIETVDCEANGTFTGLLFFEHSPNVDTVSVFYNGDYFGDHSTSSLPIVLSPLFGNGAPHFVEVQHNNQSSCADSLVYDPFCEPAPACNTEILSVNSFCVDSILNITVNYNFINPVSEVHILVNGEFVTNGMEGQNLSQTFTVEASYNSVYEIQVYDPEFTSCSDVDFLQVSSCVSDCIQDFDNGPIICNEDGTFDATFFLGASVGATNAFIDGQLVTTTPANDSTNQYVIESVSSDTVAIIRDLTVCLQNNPACCTTYSFDDPFCVPTDTTNQCNVEIFNTSFDCNQEGLFIDINYSYENPFTEAHVFVNGVYYSNAMPGVDLILGIYIPNPELIEYVIEIRDAEFPDCADQAIIQNDCDPCEVFQFVYSWDCDTDGTFNFTFENRDQQSPVAVYLDGVLIGTHDAGMPDLFVDGLDTPDGTPILVSICSDVYDCCSENTFLAPDCEEEEECLITNATMDIQCVQGEDVFVAYLTFDYNGIQGDTVKVQDYNGNLIGYYDVNQQPIEIIQAIDPSQPNSFGVVIFDASNEQCATETIQYDVPCEEFCQIYWIEYDIIDCNPDGSYNAEIFYGLESNNAQFLVVGVNGTIQDTVAVSSTNNKFILSNIVPQPGTNVDMLTLCVTDYANCCFTIEIERPICEPVECFIGNDAIGYECIGNGQYLATLVFETENTSGTLNYFIDGNLIGNFNTTQNLFSFGPFENGSPHFYSIVDAEDENCAIEGDIFWQECPEENCIIDFLEVDSILCNTDGTYSMLAVFSASNSISSFVDVNVNNQFIGTFPNTGSLYLEDITPRATSNEDIITICMNDEPNCCKTIEYAQPNCNNDDECSLKDRLVDYECLGNGEYLAYISYIAENTSNLYRLYIDGVFVKMIQSTSATVEVGPFENGTAHSYKIEDAQNPDCVLEGDLFTQECFDENNPCTIEFIEILDTSCNGDGTFDMDVLFVINNADNGFIDVFLNGDFFGFYDIDSLVTLEDIPLSLTNEVKTITICVNDNPDCCKTIDYNQPACENNTECSLDDLIVEYECNDNTGEITPYLTFNFDTVTTNEVIVNIDGINIGFYDPTQQPLILDAMLSNSADTWIITVADASDEDCTISALLEDVDCGGECIISSITYDVECLYDGTVLLYLDFFSNNTSGEVTVNGNGTAYGSFDVAQLPIELGPFNPADNDVWEFVIKDVNLDDCSSFIEIDELGCDDVIEVECLVEEIEVYNIECIGDNEYSMSVDFEIAGNASVPFTFFHNGAQVNSTASSSLPLNLIGLIPSDSSGVETITICLDGLENCCFDFVYDTPSCLSNAVDQTLLDGVDLSPNPTRDIVNINHIPQEVIGLNIVDNLGRSIAQMNAIEDMQIDVSNYLEGVYTVQFFTADNKVMNMRFVKMN